MTKSGPAWPVLHSVSWVFVATALMGFVAISVYTILALDQCTDECHGYTLLLGLGVYVGLAGMVVLRALRSVRSGSGVRDLTRLGGWILLASSIFLMAWSALEIFVRLVPADGLYPLALPSSLIGLLAFALVRRLAAS